ncbi:hypothetical protein [Nocardia sp. NBC_01009]|uniref:hypothetical protein n=1 Tax=Nocardia sp. NBC_01009 TaxID=2975996 RepID=UPI003867551D|nr:hypothetical protein OHA42_17930 [Nocardia sp. NBC_01009]
MESGEGQQESDEKRISMSAPQPSRRPEDRWAGSGASAWASIEVWVRSIVVVPKTGTNPDDVIPMPL